MRPYQNHTAFGMISAYDVGRGYCAVRACGVGRLVEERDSISALPFTDSSPSGPLRCVTVVALEQRVSAPMCSRTLADFGARVVKVETPHGGDLSRHLDNDVNGLAAHFIWVNHGGGATVNVSLFDTMMEVFGEQLNYTRHNGTDQYPLGMSSPAVAPHGAYLTADGQTVVMGTTHDAEWQRLARNVIDRPDLADDERFGTNSQRAARRTELDEAIADWCVRHELAHIQKTADAAGIGDSRFNRISEVIAHPHLEARDRWRVVNTPAGEHTEAVLTEPGVGGDQIAQLRASGVIGVSQMGELDGEGH